METHNVFPFVHIVDNNEYLNAIWNLNTDKYNSNTVNYSCCFDPLDNNEFNPPDNWNPLSCKYVTTEELFKKSVHRNMLTVTQINTRSLKKNYFL